MASTQDADAGWVGLPKLGLGTFRLEGAACEAAVASALALGYRHIDTAPMYGNEAAVGAAVAASGIARAAIFITSKVCHGLATPDSARASLEASLRQLRTDYLDLCLLHWPRDGLDIAGVLDMLARAQATGLVRRIGVANFPLHLLRTATDTVAAPLFCNQIEYHALLDQGVVLSWLRTHGMTLMAHVPLARGRLATHPVLARIGARYGATAAQIALAWLLQQDGVAVVAKAGRPASQRENLGALTLPLDDDDRTAIATLPKTERVVNPPWAPAWD